MTTTGSKPVVSFLSAIRRTEQGRHVSLMVALVRDVVPYLVFVEADR